MFPACDAARLRRIGAAALAVVLMGSGVALTPSPAAADPAPTAAQPEAPTDTGSEVDTGSGVDSGGAADDPGAITPLAIVLPGAAAPGVSGAIWIDLNGDGAETDDVLPGFGDPAVVDAGVEVGRAGVTVELLSGGTIVDSTITAADGTYSFPAAADGAYTVRALAPAQYGWTAPGGDSDLAPGVASPPALLPGTAPVTVAGGVSEPVSGGLLPLPRITLEYSDGAPAIAGGQSYLTGVSPNPSTPPVDPDGACPSAVLVPGADCSTTDGIVATNDLTTLFYSVAADQIPTGLSVPNVILEVVFTPAAGATLVIEVDSVKGVPAACAIAPASPISRIVDEAGGVKRLICNLETYDNSTVNLRAVPISVKATGASPNGSSFEVDARAYAAGNDATPSVVQEAGPITVSAAPRLEVTKRSNAGDPGGGALLAGLRTFTNPVTGVDEVYYLYRYGLSVIAAGDGKGIASIGPDFTIDEHIDTDYSVNGAYVLNCIGGLDYGAFTGFRMPHPGTSGIPSIGSTLDGGAYDCTGAPFDAATGIQPITVTSADTTGRHYPSLAGASGPSLTAKYVSDNIVTVVYPISALMKSTNPSWTYGDPIVNGTYPVTNCYGGFDPNALDGTSNYGAGYEPGWNGTTASGNNCINHNIVVQNTNGVFEKTFGTYLFRNANDVTQGSHSPCYTDSLTNPYPFGPLGVGGCRTGDGFTTPGATNTSVFSLNNGSSLLPRPNTRFCDVWDNSVQNLRPLGGTQAPGELSYLLYGNSSVNPTVSSISGAPAGWTVEYGRLIGATTWNNDLLAGVADPNTGQIPGTWVNQRAAAQDCGESLQAAGGIEFTTTPQASGWDLDTVVMMRLTPPNGVMDPLSSIIVIPKLVARSTFYGGPDAGQPIPQGVILANFSNLRGATGYPANTYDPNTHTGVNSRNDRMVMQLVTIGISKTADVKGAAAGSDGLLQIDAGDSVLWSILPTVTGNSEASLATNVRVVDTLPAGTDIDLSCTPEPPAGSTRTRTEVVISGVPRVQVTWSFGDRPPGPLPRLVLCTTTDSTLPTGTDITNRSEVLADNVRFVAALHRDDRTVRMFSPGGVRAQMTVDRSLDLQDDDQVWTLRWANLSDAAVAATDTIFVFPFVGDGSGPAARDTYESAYAGSLRLTEALANPTGPGGTPVAGTWYYTSAASASVAHAANDASNLPSGATQWCTAAQFGTAGCPADAAAATAARFVQDGTLGAQMTLTANVPLQAIGNAPGDLYVGRFGTYTATFGAQPIVSNEPYVQVLGFALGDLIWVDVNQNGAYDSGTDTVAPAGSAVEVWRDNGGAGVKVADAIVGADGRWFVDGLASGAYWALIPASQFADGAPLAGLLPSAPGFSPHPNADVNELGDHHAIAVVGGVRSSGLMTLSATITEDAILGDEPLGDDVAALVPALIDDSFTNLTLDLALIVSSSITVQKVVVDPNPYDLSGDAAAYVVSIDCTGPTGYPGVSTTASLPATGTPVTVGGLYAGSICAVTEIGTDGGTATYSPTGPVTVPAAGSTEAVTVTVTNTFPAAALGSIVVSKTIVDPDAFDDAGDATTFPVTISCTGPVGYPSYETTIAINRDGSPVTVDGLYQGATCLVTETDTDGGAATYSPGPVVVVGAAPTTLTITNTFPATPPTPTAPPAGTPTVAPSEAGVGSASPLARTGADVARLAVLGAAMALAGLALVLRLRPHRH